MTPEAIETELVNDVWDGCYNGSWKDHIVPEAFSHPAKMAYGLLERIYDHAVAEGWLHAGSVVADPFGGIGSTGLLGAYRGVQVVCVELEEKFCRLTNGYDCPGITKKEWVRWFGRFGRNKEICPACQGSIDKWYERNSGMIPCKEAHRYRGNFELHDNAWRKLGCPRPVMIQGDSRQLSEIIGRVECIVTSPPYSESLQHDGQSRSEFADGRERRKEKSWQGMEYGHSPGQLGAMKPGSVDAALPPGQVSAIISSPPYEGSEGSPSGGRLQTKSGGTMSSKAQKQYGLTAQYGEAEGQLGHTQGDTFWSAAKIICEQCYQILKPGGVAIWVLKDFVRNKKRVDFTSDWRKLCEAAGFVTLHKHHAMLVKEERYTTLFGDEVVDRTKSASFFRFIYEAKTAWKNYWATLSAETQAEYIERADQADPELHITSPLKLAFDESGEDPNDWNDDVRIDYEVVLCMQK